MQDAFAMFDTPAQGVLTGAQFGAGAVGSYTSTKSYDTGVAGVPPVGITDAAGGHTLGGPVIHDLGRGIRLNFDARIHVAVTSAGAATVEVDFISSATADLAAATTLLLTPAIGKAALVIGYRFRHGHTPGVVPGRFVGAQVVIGTAALTAGTYSSGLMLDQEDHADVLG